MENLTVFAILMIPLLILGLYGNGMLVCAIVKFKQLRHRNGVLVGILGLLDFVSFLKYCLSLSNTKYGKSH